jgi:signal transduction histidine kinase
MPRTRDRVAAALAALLVVLIGGLILVAVRSAERNGRDALEELETEQVQQLARGMARRFEGLSGVATGLAQTPFTLEPGDADDEERLSSLVLDPEARTGVVLIDANRTVRNGVLLGPLRVGDRLELDGLADAMAASTFSVLPVQPGLTTSAQTVAVVFPLEGGDGAVIAELEVAGDSSFNEEVAELGRGNSGQFFFVDQRGTVLASSDPALLGRPVDDPEAIAAASGGLRRSDGMVVATADVEGIGWTAVFRQRTSEFEGGLTGPIQQAVLLVVIGAVVGGAILFVTLLRRLRLAREEQRRLAEISAAREEFVSIVSHELRTPVAGVLGFLETTLDHWDAMSDEDRLNAVSRAAANARRLQALSRDVLDTATIEAGELTCTFDDVELGAAIRDGVIGAGDVHVGREVSFDAPDEPIWVRADPDRLQQVLANLLDNAAKSSPPDKPILVEVERDSSHALVTVTDQGAGLGADASADRLFDKFVRGRGHGVRGTGLGLYISRQIVEAHGGRIWAENLPGRGAQVSFTVPLATADAAAGGQESEP